ncbi:similar to SMN22587 hypothetical protein [Kazachstania saulgeensis CLIB 1764] [Maudiozyma barnettii]|nr:similar to SMN22587 hypothetical protein [Kazachstania saulgeensis CLIB 1764] [Kazachstania barnettii]
MDAFQRNDSIILKGTNFKFKPLFGHYVNPKFNSLVFNLMAEYGHSITKGQPIMEKGYYRPVPQPGRSLVVKPVHTALQPFYRPYFDRMLLIIGSDRSSTIVLSSPIKGKPKGLCDISEFTGKSKGYDVIIQCMEGGTLFTPLNYDTTKVHLKKDWHKTVTLRRPNGAKFYVVPNPLEYFPMLFVNCSQKNIKNIYANITSLLLAKKDPRFYDPSSFLSAIQRPLVFRIVGSQVLHRQRLPGIDVTEEEYVHRRNEYLCRRNRYMVSDCRCRSNVELIEPFPQNPPEQECSWACAEAYNHNVRIRSLGTNHYVSCYTYNASSEPPRYTQRNNECECSTRGTELREAKEEYHIYK